MIIESGAGEQQETRLKNLMPPKMCHGFRLKQYFSTCNDRSILYPLPGREFSKLTLRPFCYPCLHRNDKSPCDQKAPTKYRLIEAVAKKNISTDLYLELTQPQTNFIVPDDCKLSSCKNIIYLYALV